MRKLDKLQIEYQKQKEDRSVNSNLKRLAMIEETKLANAFTSESESMLQLSRMREGIYDEIEALVLGSKSQRTHTKVQELMRELPPYVATVDGISALQELEMLSSLKAGELPYFISGSPTPQRVNVCDLYGAETTPKVEDLPVPLTT